MKKEVSNEILKNKNLIEHFRKKVWEIRNILNEGKDNFKWEIKTQYDLDKGILYFSPQNYIEWVKMWPLRLVQYSYALSLMRKIRDSWTHLEFIEKIPTNMLDRLDFLLNEFIALISPRLPMLIRSSTSTSAEGNFLATYTTSLKLCSISFCFAISHSGVDSISI